MRIRLPILALALVLACGLAAAQDAETEKPATEDKSKIESIAERMRRAIRLPQTTEESREAGAEESKIREILREARERAVPAGDMQEILETENDELRRGGNPENFGAVVQALKAQGLRGRELAEAIHAEQIARGMKKPKEHKGLRALAKGARGKGKGKGQPNRGEHGILDDERGDDGHEEVDEHDEDDDDRGAERKPRRKGAARTRGNG
jgi:hypothetical protein